MTRLLLVLTAAGALWGTARHNGEGGARPHGLRLSSINLHVCAVLDDATVECWGNNSSGQVGNGSSAAPVPSPAVALNAASVSAGGSHSCAVLSNTTVSCWGSNG